MELRLYSTDPGMRVGLGIARDDAARDFGVLIEVVAGADPVISVGNPQWLSAHQEDGRELDARLHFAQVLLYLMIIRRKEGQSTRSQNVFGHEAHKIRMPFQSLGQ